MPKRRRVTNEKRSNNNGVWVAIGAALLLFALFKLSTGTTTPFPPKPPDDDDPKPPKPPDEPQPPDPPTPPYDPSSGANLTSPKEGQVFHVSI